MDSDAFHSYEQNYTDIAIMEPVVNRLCREIQECQAGLRRAQQTHAELRGELEMMCDSVENVQWGLIHMGGYTHFHTMDTAQRQQMYTTEGANLIAARTMGMQRYLNVVRSQNTGVVSGGDDIDMANAEGAEPEAPEHDSVVDPNEGNLSTVAQTFRNEVNSCLQREALHDAASFQHALIHVFAGHHQPEPATNAPLSFWLLGIRSSRLQRDNQIQRFSHGICSTLANDVRWLSCDVLANGGNSAKQISKLEN